MDERRSTSRRTHVKFKAQEDNEKTPQVPEREERRLGLERRRGKKDIGVVGRRQSKEGRRVETRRRRGDK